VYVFVSVCWYLIREAAVFQERKKKDRKAEGEETERRERDRKKMVGEKKERFGK
jgi:hypothetical protein